MSNWSEQQEAKKEVKEKDRVRREKLAGFFFNLAQLTYLRDWFLGELLPYMPMWTQA